MQKDMMKKRTYTVQEVAGVPCLTLRGKFLRNFGLDVGSQVQLLEGKNMIVLVKVPEHVTSMEQKQKEIRHMERQVRYLKGAV